MSPKRPPLEKLPKEQLLDFYVEHIFIGQEKLRNMLTLIYELAYERGYKDGKASSLQV